MNGLFLDLIKNNTGKSSGRFLNLLGGASIVLVFISDFFYNGKIDIAAMAIVAAYASGNYGMKQFSEPKGVKDVTATTSNL